jgi:hypothetical protein
MVDEKCAATVRIAGKGESKAHTCANGKRIIAITNEQMAKPDFADDLVYGVEGPGTLIESIRAAGELSRYSGAGVQPAFRFFWMVFRSAK